MNKVKGRPPGSGNLPTPVSTFIGREKEIATVKGLILENRLVTLTGAGGSGKTRLALKVSHELLEELENRVRFIELAPLGDPAFVTQEIASTLNVHDQSSRPLLDSLVYFFSTHPSLLILDNCEHLIEACAEIADTLLQKCADLRILATSREVLGITGEAAWVVPPLSLPEVQAWKSPASAQEALDEYQKSESVRLFIARAKTNSPEFKFTVHNGAWVAEICRRLDGMPLAIELAAAHIRTLSVKQISERLDDRFTLLTGGSRTAPARHQTLAATVEWSYDLLSKKEQKLLRRFSVFPGSGTLHAIESVCEEDGGKEKGNVLDTLSQLVDKSLVGTSRRSGERWYSLLETIREFAFDKLAESQEMKSVKDQHLDYYLQFAEEAEPKIKSPEQLLWYERLETEHDNLRAALGWALESQNADAGLRLAGSLGFFWFVHGHLREGVVWLEKVLENGEGAPLSSQAKALRFLGGLLIFSEEKDFERISMLLEKSLGLYRKLDDRAGIAWVLNQLGLIAYIHGEFTEAQKLLEESLVLREQVGDPWEIAQTLGNFATVALKKNDLASAREFSEKAIAWFQQAGDQRGTAMNTGELGEIIQMEGDYERAFTLLTQSLSQLAQFDDNWATASGLESLANLVFERGDLKRGVILYGAAEALREDVGMPLTPDQYETYEDDMATARKDLGEKVFTRAQAEGRAMTLEQVIEFVLHEPESPSTVQAEKERVGGLTRREREAAVLIAQGMSNREIAEAMTVTEKTVEAYVTRILRKLGCDSRVQIATWVIENNLD